MTRRCQFFSVHLEGSIVALGQLSNALGVDVKTDDGAMSSKCHGQRQTHVPKTDNRDSMRRMRHPNGQYKGC